MMTMMMMMVITISVMVVIVTISMVMTVMMVSMRFSRTIRISLITGISVIFSWFSRFKFKLKIEEKLEFESPIIGINHVDVISSKFVRAEFIIFSKYSNFFFATLVIAFRSILKKVHFSSIFFKIHIYF